MHAALRQELTRLAATQHGLVASRQLREAGIPAGARRWAIRSGELERFRYRVLRVPTAPGSDVQVLMAACLASGEDAVASYWAAGGLHRFHGVAPGGLEITSPRRLDLSGVSSHYTRRPLDPRDRTRCDSVPVTAVPRTLVDLASTGLLRLVERALDDALVRGLCTVADVESAMARAGRRSGMAGMRDLLAARRGEPRYDSHQELRFVRAIRRELGCEPTLHHRIVVAGKVCEIDIALEAAKVGFEVNGWQCHGTRSAFDHHARKGLLLLQAGWRIGTLTSAMSDQEVVNAARHLGFGLGHGA